MEKTAMTDLRLVYRWNEDTKINPNYSFTGCQQSAVSQWDEKTLIVAWMDKVKGRVDMGPIRCSVSHDCGDTWGDPITVLDMETKRYGEKTAFANAVLYKVPDKQEMYLFAMHCPMYYHDSEDSHLCAAKTTDGGKTWQDVDLEVNYHLPLIIVSEIFKWKDRYILPFHRNTWQNDPECGDQRHGVLISQDLVHWELGGYIKQREEDKVFLHEGAMAYVQDDDSDEICMIMRTAEAKTRTRVHPLMCSFSSYSKDGGKTWSVAKPEIELHNATAKNYFGKDRLGNWIYIYDNCGADRYRKDLMYRIRKPHGEWSEERVFYQGENRNSYPYLYEYAPGEFYCTFDSSCSPEVKRTAIRFGKFSTKNLP